MSKEKPNMLLALLIGAGLVLVAWICIPERNQAQTPVEIMYGNGDELSLFANEFKVEPD